MPTPFQQWNKHTKHCLQVHLPSNCSPQQMVQKIAAIRSNLSSAINLGKADKEEITLFNQGWEEAKKMLESQGYEAYPSQIGPLGGPIGKVIYSCSPKATENKNVLIVPGLKKAGKTVLPPISLSIYPLNKPFPTNQPYSNLPVHWRGILGEMEILLLHLELQTSVACGIEAINKTSLVPYEKFAEAIRQEVKRRKDTIAEALKKDTSGYQLATDYWRVEECFWSLFHNDDRPQGFSFFDILRKRIQEWRLLLRKDSMITVKDFIPKKDQVASINKEISGMILKKDSNLPPGTVLWSLRPMITVKEKNVTRTLKGRVISS